MNSLTCRDLHAASWASPTPSLRNRCSAFWADAGGVAGEVVVTFCAKAGVFGAAVAIPEEQCWDRDQEERHPEGNGAGTFSVRGAGDDRQAEAEGDSFPEVSEAFVPVGEEDSGRLLKEAGRDLNRSVDHPDRTAGADTVDTQLLFREGWDGYEPGSDDEN